MSFLTLALILLSAAVVMVPIFRKLGLGSVLGYLVAGVALGPWGFQWITGVEEILHFSELGVVFLLFLIGLELEPKKLWSLRMPILGMGSAQLGVSALLTGIVLWAMGYGFAAALIGGLGFGLSSTAIALQILEEKNLLSTRVGSHAFSVLLFQDLAVIPMLALLPLLGNEEASGHSGAVAPWIALLILAGVAVLGRFLLRPALRLVASVEAREVFTAFALLLVIGMAVLMQKLGLSMALGAFVAGVLLADSEYRTALETDLEPFKGLLLGLFFLSVGMAIDFGGVLANPIRVGVLVILVVGLKLAAQLGLARLFKLSDPFFFGLVISQVGEFAFVFFGAAKSFGILSESLAGEFMAVTAVSMLTTPLLALFHERIWEPRQRNALRPPDDAIENESPEVIIAGFGRVGQIVGRFLQSQGIRSTVLDHEPDLIENLRKFGFKVYFGDATRPDLLEAAGAREAKLIVNAIDDREESLRFVDMVRENFPNLRILARARNVQHYYELLDRGVHLIERETFDSSLRIGVSVLRELGMPVHQAAKASQRFRRYDERMLQRLYPKRKDTASEYSSQVKQARAQLEGMMAQDQERQAREGGDVWGQ